MMPKKQNNIYGTTKKITGECFRACICSLLELDTDGIPVSAEDSRYPSLFINFLHSRGLDIYFSDEVPNHVEYYIGFGQSPNGIRHSAIYKNGIMVHNPCQCTDTNIIPDSYAWLQRD